MMENMFYGVIIKQNMENVGGEYLKAVKKNVWRRNLKFARSNSQGKSFIPYPSDRFLEESRVKCKCGHSVNFINKIPYVECSYCHNLIFRNKKCEFDYKIKRKVIK